MIGIVDYGMGNLGSVSNACHYLGLPFSILSAPEEMSGCKAVILPGVGAFGDCMNHLARHGYVDAVRGWIEAGNPFLGICLGLQVLYEGSEESPGVAGLGILPGVSRRFVLPPEWKIPQIGWNRVRQVRRDCPLFEGVADGAYFYFVHSYYSEFTGAPYEAGTTAYGLEYTSIVWRDNILAVQFHPEKSQKSGLQMLRNFGRWAGSR